jgi:hypothetical protein
VAGPGLLFFTFIYLNFVNSGYLLVLTPPLFAWVRKTASAGRGETITVISSYWRP